MRRISGVVPGALVLALAAVSCRVGDQSATGYARTDREARTLADAISYPRRSSAAAYGRELASPRPSAHVSVLQARDVHARRLGDVSVHLEFRIHHEADENPDERVPITACYALDLSYYGVARGPRRFDCPPHAAAITFPAAPPPATVPGGFDAALEAVLAGSPPTPTRDGVLAALSRAMPPLPADPTTHLAAPAPTVEVAVRGADVGVAYFARDDLDRECLFGSRVNGDVKVWRPSAIQVAPGELSCDGATALARRGTSPPH